MGRLLPQDYQFIELIQQEISEHSAIQLEIKPDKIKTIIGDAAKWFYEYHPSAIQRQQYVLKRSDIVSKLNSGINSIIKLPESIKFIFRIRRANGISLSGQANHLTNSIYGMNRFQGSMSSRGMSLGGTNTHGAVSHVLSLYEFQTLNSLSNNNRGVAHSFSEFTNEISFLSDVDNDLVCEVGVRVPISSLYSDLYFKNYVKGKALESLSRILGTYDYKLIGGVTINWSEMKSDGKEICEKIEEEIKQWNTNSFIISR